MGTLEQAATRGILALVVIQGQADSRATVARLGKAANLDPVAILATRVVLDILATVERLVRVGLRAIRDIPAIAG